MGFFTISTLGVFTIAAICIVSLSSTQAYAGDYGSCGCNGGTKKEMGETKEEACKKARKECRRMKFDDCHSNYVCNRYPRCSSVHEEAIEWGKKFQCTVTCAPKKKNYKCIHYTQGGGYGDPHLTGFDRSTFEFHGESEKNYIIFGKPKGDLLVSKMRASWIMRGDGVKKTYFNEFGLQTTDSEHQVRIALAEKDLASKEWKLQVELDGALITENTKAGNSQIEINQQSERATVKTADAIFKFEGKLLTHPSARHLNVEIKLVNKPNPSSNYVGILGVTLNRAMGLKTAEQFSERAIGLESSLRKQFETESLFPSIGENENDLSGIVRNSISIEDIVLDEQNWIAKSHSS